MDALEDDLAVTITKLSARPRRYGGAFLVLLAVLGTQDYVWMGLLLGAIGRLLANLAMMPMAGNRVFGINLSGMVPVMSLMMHLVFGGLLGWFYALLVAA